MGVTVFSLGVGNAFDVNQLNTMATDPDREHVFTADFKQLGSSVIEKIKEKACKGELCLHFRREAAWPSGQRVGLAIRRSRVQVPL